MIKVKLVHDYTKYNKSLCKGHIGYAAETPEEQSQRSPNNYFVKVYFDECTVDVLWRGLEIIDEEYLKSKKEEREKFLSQLSTAEHVVLTIGPNEGFKNLSLDFILNGEKTHQEIEDKIIANEYLNTIKNFGISIKTIQLEKKIPIKKTKK